METGSPVFSKMTTQVTAVRADESVVSASICLHVTAMGAFQ